MSDVRERWRSGWLEATVYDSVVEHDQLNRPAIRPDHRPRLDPTRRHPHPPSDEPTHPDRTLFIHDAPKPRAQSGRTQQRERPITSFTSITTSHNAPESPSNSPFVHVIHSPSATSHKATIRSPHPCVNWPGAAPIRSPSWGSATGLGGQWRRPATKATAPADVRAAAGPAPPRMPRPLSRSSRLRRGGFEFVLRG